MITLNLQLFLSPLESCISVCLFKYTMMMLLTSLARTTTDSSQSDRYTMSLLSRNSRARRSDSGIMTLAL